MVTVLSSKDEFQEKVLNAKTPVLVDFFAEWCGPCKMIAPVLEDVGQELAETAFVCKVNSDELGEICTEYGVKLLPTLLIFKEGTEVERIIGTEEATQEILVEKVKSYM
ncbi:MAG: thioredoxin [bacterium]